MRSVYYTEKLKLEKSLNSIVGMQKSELENLKQVLKIESLKNVKVKFNKFNNLQK